MGIHDCTKRFWFQWCTNECQCNQTTTITNPTMARNSTLYPADANNSDADCFNLTLNICYRLGWFNTTQLETYQINETTCKQYGDGYSLPTNETYYLLFENHYNCLTSDDLSKFEINLSSNSDQFGTFASHGIAIDWPNGCGCDWNNDIDCQVQSINTHNGRKW